MDSSRHRSLPDGPFQPELLCVRGPLEGRSYVLGEGELTIGSDSENEIRVLDPGTSRVHARIRRTGRRVLLLDLESRNGTTVNGRAVGERDLEHGDVIGIGGSLFVFSAAPEGRRPRSEPVPNAACVDDDRVRHTRVRARLEAADRALASREGQALEGRLVERLAGSLQAIHDLVEPTAAGADPEELMERSASLLVGAFEAECACILLHDPQDDRLLPASFAYRSGREGQATILDEVLVEEVAREGASLLCEVAGRGRLASPGESVMCAPLVAGERFLGLTWLQGGGEGGAYTRDDLRVFRAIAGQLALFFDSVRLVSSLRARVRELTEQCERHRRTLIGESEAIREVLRMACRAADSEATILVLGESGTGKEVLARSIHRWSERRDGPFLVVNCAVLADALLESELFGHERGAFTGAVRRKQGRLETANGGTVFLDEIGEISPAIQAKLLRFFEEREFERIGGTGPIRVEVRIVATSNRDLEGEVRRGRFREDLFYRLRVVEIRLPPLRERREDIPLLAAHFLDSLARETKLRIDGFTARATRKLLDHDWPGNVRELRNVVERAALFCRGSRIDEDDLGPLASATCSEGGAGARGYHEQVRDLKRQVIRSALDRCGGVQAAAARELGLQPSYLSRLMKKLGCRFSLALDPLFFRSIPPGGSRSRVSGISLPPRVVGCRVRPPDRVSG